LTLISRFAVSNGMDPVRLDRPRNLYILVWVIAFGKGTYVPHGCVRETRRADGVRRDRPHPLSPEREKKGVRL